MTIKIDVKDAEVLEKKLTLIFCKSSVEQRKRWFKAWLAFGSETRQMACVDEYKEEIGFKGAVLVTVDLEHAKTLREILNDHLVAHPYEKDEFFAELCRLEEAIERAEKRQE